LRWPLPLRLTAAGVALPLMFSPSRLPEPGTVRISVLDAGRGAAVLVATHSRLLLFDTGDGWNTHGTRAARVVLPALDALGRRRLDLLVLPVLDADRARGAALLASEGEVGRIIVGGGWPATVLPAAACKDARFEWDGVRFEIFAAGPADRHCLLRVAVGERAVLLGGNLDSAAGALASEVVVLWQPSARGSSPEWIEANAGLAGRVIAAGGMPGSETRARVLARWRRAGVAVFDTSRDGAIDFSFGTQGVFAFDTARSARYPFAWRRFK
jgi:competence protein ComEC